MELTRRDFLAAAAAAGTGLAARGQGAAAEDREKDAPRDGKALVAITFDLEMSRNFPAWDDTHWDFKKGDLDEPTKRYAVAAARRVKASGGRIHFFAVGRVFEQESVAWLEEIAREGHPIGNHTYDHVNVKATRPEDIQFRFRRAPWLIHGKEPRAVIAENIRLTALAMKARLGIEPAGFRTPGGFNVGLDDRPDVQQMLLDQGYRWVSSRYPAHPVEPDFAAIVKAQVEAQPYRYESGLIEAPMSPVSDVTAFRAGRWPLATFLEAIGKALDAVIERGLVFDFLAHPSCLGVVDPEMRAIDLILDRVARSAGRADLSTLENESYLLRGRK